MSEQIDWSKAPEDATHYQAATHGVFECWLKAGHAVRVSRREPDWREDDYADDLIATSAIKRPWSGEGLPPVGFVCEVRNKTPGYCAFPWEKCTIALTNIGANGCVQICTIDHRGDFAIYYPEVDIIQFRPIRTPEQIAADEREAAIKDIEDMIAGYSYRHCAELIHDNGYRKP